MLFASFFPNQIEFNIEWKIHQESRQNVVLEVMLALNCQCWTSVHPSWRPSGRALRGATSHPLQPTLDPITVYSLAKFDASLPIKFWYKCMSLAYSVNNVFIEATITS